MGSRALRSRGQSRLLSLRYVRPRMTRVFADAGYWIALLNPRDGLHAKARSVSEGLGNPRIVTSELVLMEVFNALAGKGEFRRRAAGALFDRIRLHVDAEIVPMISNI